MKVWLGESLTNSELNKIVRTNLIWYKLFFISFPLPTLLWRKNYISLFLIVKYFNYNNRTLFVQRRFQSQNAFGQAVKLSRYVNDVLPFGISYHNPNIPCSEQFILRKERLQSRNNKIRLKVWDYFQVKYFSANRLKTYHKRYK